jgi:hypothetical protein
VLVNPGLEVEFDSMTDCGWVGDRVEDVVVGRPMAEDCSTIEDAVDPNASLSTMYQRSLNGAVVV